MLRANPSFRLPALRTLLGILVLLAVLFIASIWTGPLQEATPSLELVALGAQSRFTSVIDLANVATDTAPPRSTGVPRVPLVLALHNAGERTGRAIRIELSVPSWLRLYDARGYPITGRHEVGSPLVHIRLNTSTGPIEPGGTPVVLPGYEEIGMELDTSPVACVIDADGIPDFVPAPAYDPVLLSRVQIFYSIAEDAPGPRSTGLLTLRLDPALARSSPADSLPRFPLVARRDSLPPDTATFTFIGTREAGCGEIDRPVRLHTTTYETPRGARVFAIRFHDRLRSFLFDLDNDGRIDVEVRDADGDGAFESGRRMRLPVPAFLLPVREPPDSTPLPAILPPEPVVPDTTARDTLR